MSVLQSSMLQKIQYSLIAVNIPELQLSIHVVFASAEAILNTEVASSGKTDRVIRTVVRRQLLPVLNYTSLVQPSLYQYVSHCRIIKNFSILSGL